MHLDVPTLIAATLIVNLTVGCFCVTCWYGRRDRQIYLWLTLSSATAAIGCFLMILRGYAPNWLGIWLAQSMLLVAIGLLWAGVRVFEQRQIQIRTIVAGAALWTLLCLVPAFYSELTNRTVGVAIFTSAYFIWITVDLLKGYQKEPSRSRIVVCVLTAFHAVACLSRIGFAYYVEGFDWPTDARSTGVGAFVIETIVSVIGVVLTLTTMERDRAEMEQRKVASTDALTGAMNRRAFLDTATDWIEHKGKDAALVLFDLDHFKKINDTFGHAGGDAALIGFAELVSRRIEIANIIAGFNLDQATSTQYPRWYETTLADAAEGGEPMFGRIGGEEFACLLPHLSLPQGLAIAEDIRNELQALVISIDGRRIPISVSASVVTTADIGHRLNMMLTSADHALYRAKDNGRNRVETGVSDHGMLIRHYA